MGKIQDKKELIRTLSLKNSKKKIAVALSWLAHRCLSTKRHFIPPLALPVRFSFSLLTISHIFASLRRFDFSAIVLTNMFIVTSQVLTQSWYFRKAKTVRCGAKHEQQDLKGQGYATNRERLSSRGSSMILLLEERFTRRSLFHPFKKALFRP